MADVDTVRVAEVADGLRQVVAKEVGEMVRQRAGSAGRKPNEEDRLQRARSVIQRELTQWDEGAILRGESALSDDERDAVTKHVLAAVSRPAPTLDRLLAERPDITDIHANGYDDVWMVRFDGSLEKGPPIAASDAGMVAMIGALARHGGHMEREFSSARPTLDLQLEDGSRLAAVYWVTPRPYLTIRKHRLVDSDLDELCGLGMFDRGVRSLLGAMVAARWSVLICGGAQHGKTTLLRAMLHECGRSERLVVLEQEPELHLERRPDRHDQVLSFRERAANSEGVGEVTLADLSKTVKRFTPDRLAVGEVRGAEVVDMLEAMCQGVPAMGTIHADSSAGVFPRLDVYARTLTSDKIQQLAALALDAVLFVNRDRSGRRVLAEIRGVDRFDPDTRQVVTDAWFEPGPDGRARPNPTSPIPVRLLDELAEYGYDPRLHGAGSGR